MTALVISLIGLAIVISLAFVTERLHDIAKAIREGKR